MARPLTKQQKRFAKEYVKDLNGTQAAIRASYSPKTAREQAARLLTKVNIVEFIQELQKKRSDKLEIDAEYVLKRHVEIDEMDIIDIMDHDGNITKLSEWPKVWRQFITGIEISELKKLSSGEDKDAVLSLVKKIKWPDKVRNLELLGKHINVQAYNDKYSMDVNVTDDVLGHLSKNSAK